MVGCVDGGVTEAVVLCDVVTGRGGGVEGGGKRAEVEADATLGLRDEKLGGDDGAASHARVG
jgi:hypothetical protein